MSEVEAVERGFDRSGVKRLETRRETYVQTYRSYVLVRVIDGAVNLFVGPDERGGTKYGGGHSHGLTAGEALHIASLLTAAAADPDLTKPSERAD